MIESARRRPDWAAIAEIAAGWLFLFVYVGGRTPDVNEVHYLAKARHFWQPDWCPRDPFLLSADAHLVFLAVAGWFTQWFSLDVVAWVGRAIAWWLVVLGWYRMTSNLGFRLGLRLLSLGLVVALARHFHLAGEWFVGGFEGKSLAYGFAFLALAETWRPAKTSDLPDAAGQPTTSLALASGRAPRWDRVIFWLGLATAFHAVVGGWIALAVVAGKAIERPLLGRHRGADDPPESLPSREGASAILRTGLGIALMLAAIVPLVRMQAVTDAATVRAANVIHVYERLPHHLVPHRFARAHHLRFSLLVLTWAALAWVARRDPRTRLVGSLVAFSLGLVAIGWCIDGATREAPEVGAAWLRYYWFRLADVVVPLGVVCTGILVARPASIDQLGGAEERDRPRRLPAQCLVCGLIVVILSTLHGFRDHRNDPRPGADRQGSFGQGGDIATQLARYRDWLAVCEWVRGETPNDALFVTPIRSQTLKWYAERSEFVTWKDCPQDAAGVLAWKARIDLVKGLNLYGDGPPPGHAEIVAAAVEHGWDYILTLRPRPFLAWPQAPLYANGTFEIHAIDRHSVDAHRASNAVAKPSPSKYGPAIAGRCCSPRPARIATERTAAAWAHR